MLENYRNKPYKTAKGNKEIQEISNFELTFCFNCPNLLSFSSSWNLLLIILSFFEIAIFSFYNQKSDLLT